MSKALAVKETNKVIEKLNSGKRLDRRINQDSLIKFNNWLIRLNLLNIQINEVLSKLDSEYSQDTYVKHNLKRLTNIIYDRGQVAFYVISMMANRSLCEATYDYHNYLTELFCIGIDSYSEEERQKNRTAVHEACVGIFISLFKNNKEFNSMPVEEIDGVRDNIKYIMGYYDSIRSFENLICANRNISWDSHKKVEVLLPHQIELENQHFLELLKSIYTFCCYMEDLLYFSFHEGNYWEDYVNDILTDIIPIDSVKRLIK